MKTKITFFIFVIFMSGMAYSGYAQVAVNTDGSLPDPSAGLDVKFDHKGFLPPRMTVLQQRMIENPAMGLMVFNIDSLDLYIFNGSY